MIRVGLPPYLECSTKGDKRFSALVARPNGDAMTIEERYQAYKVFGRGITDVKVSIARGQEPKNQKDCSRLYHCLWEMYLITHPRYYQDLFQWNGYSDTFGIDGHACQATTIHFLVEQGLRPLTEVQKEIEQLYEKRKEVIHSLKTTI